MYQRLLAGDKTKPKYSSTYAADDLTGLASKIITNSTVTKYPFKNSTLRFMLNPRLRPNKTLGGSEFYDSRNLECDESEPNLDQGAPGQEQKLGKLGKKLSCYKAKYFGKNPLDSPIFEESINQVEEITPYLEMLNSSRFGERIRVGQPTKNVVTLLTPKFTTTTIRTPLVSDRLRPPPVEEFEDQDDNSNNEEEGEEDRGRFRTSMPIMYRYNGELREESASNDEPVGVRNRHRIREVYNMRHSPGYRSSGNRFPLHTKVRYRGRPLYLIRVKRGAAENQKNSKAIYGRAENSTLSFDGRRKEPKYAGVKETGVYNF